MPKPPKRRRPSSPDKLRRRRARQQQGRAPHGSHTLSGPELAAQLDDLTTSEDIQAFSDYVDASAAGDPALARECLRRGLVVHASPQLAHLDELLDLGDDAPSWALARWASQQACRWMLHEEDPRTDDAVMTVIAACYPDVDLDRPLGLSLMEFGTRIMAADWVANQLVVYESVGLDDFLDVKISESLRARCGPIHRWPGAPLGGYRIDGTEDGRLQLCDLRDGSHRTALDIGATSDRMPGCTVIGRLVPIDVEPGWFFESRPLEVDPATARGVARSDDVDDWLDVLRRARLAGRLPLHFSSATATPLTSDLVPLDGWEGSCGCSGPGRPAASTAPAIVELEEAGLDPLRANNIGVCDVALIVAQVAPESLSAVGCSLQAVLTDRRTYEAAQVHRTAPQYAAGWRALASVVPEPVRSRCLDLADRSSGANA